jgi:hypothetical protein
MDLMHVGKIMVLIQMLGANYATRLISAIMKNHETLRRVNVPVPVQMIFVDLYHCVNK